MSDRSEIEVRIRPLSEQGREPDLQTTSMAERIEMMWQLALDAWAFQEGGAGESRLQRHVIRIERRGG